MLLSDSNLLSQEITIIIINLDGRPFSAQFLTETSVEEVKSRSLNYFYSDGSETANNFKLVLASDNHTLRDYSSLSQENVKNADELLLVERRVPEAGALWDLGAIRAPPQSAIANATSALPASRPNLRQISVQALLASTEASNEFRKTLISLIEVGARLAAGGRNYKTTLGVLVDALDETTTRSHQEMANQVVILPATPKEEVEQKPKIKARVEDGTRAELLQKFIDKFKKWCQETGAKTDISSLSKLVELGFTEKDAVEALGQTAQNEAAAVMWLLGERQPSLLELINGLPDGPILQALLKKPEIQRSLLNTRMLLGFIKIVGDARNAALWLGASQGGPLLLQILRTFHSEKYALAVNQYTQQNSATEASASATASFSQKSTYGHTFGFGQKPAEGLAEAEGLYLAAENEQTNTDDVSPAP